MRNFSFSAYLLALLAQIVLAPPPPANYRAGGDREVSPQYATLSSPLSGQRFFRGQAFPISFTDPGTSATEARFSLSNYTGVYFISKASLKSKGRISYKVTLPAWVADGTYDFVVSENDGPFGSDDFNTDVVICTIFVGHARANQIQFAPFRNQVEENQKKINSDPKTTDSSHALQKRAPHPPKFVTPLSNQSVKAGSPIPIRFLDGQLDPGVTQARFVLRPLVKPIGPQELVLAGPNATEDGLYKFEGVAIVTNVTFPEGTPPGVYSLEAEEEYPQSPQRFQSVATIQIQIVAEDAIVTQQEPLGIDQEMEEEIQLATNRASLKIRSESSSPPQKKLVAQEVYSTEKVKDVGSVQIRVAQLRPLSTLNSRDLLTKDASQLSSWGGVPKPLEKKVHPLLPVAVPEHLPQSQPVAPKKFQVRQTRDSPSMLEPVPNQEVPSGSTFLCKIQDKHATSETVRFVLRSFGGYEQYLGSTKFVNGIATLKATCPSNLRYDTYNIVALVNSIKKPQRFLDVISASVIVSHRQTLMMASQAPLLPPKKSSSTAQLIVPVYNQFISGGKVFQCQLSNGINAERVKFCLRFDDGRSDLQVGNCEMKKNVAQTMCQIPSSVTPGTYTFVAQKSSTSKPDLFEDVDQVTITLANPRGFGPDLENQQANEVVKRSLETAQSRQAAQVSVLLEPMSYQSIVPGQVFNVKMTKNTAPLSTMLKFLFKPMSTAFVHKEYVLGTSSNDQTVDETLRCPDHITLGDYLFVVQANDPNDPEKFIDSNSTPIVVNSKSTTSPTINTNSTSNNNNTIASDPTPAPAHEPAPAQPAPAQPAPNPTTEPMRYSNHYGTPISPNSSAVQPPPAKPVDRASTPLGQGYSRNSSNIFASSAAAVPCSLFPAFLRLSAQSFAIILSFAFFF